MSAASTNAAPGQTDLDPSVGTMASRPLLPALVLLALVTTIRVAGTVDSDVAWQLWIAGRIHSGAILYRDIIETNPPLWFWMALPLDRFASLFHVRVEAVLVAVISALIALALAGTNCLTREIAPQRRALLLAYGALALAAMPWVHVGQREQLTLIGTIPYAALVASRRDNKPVSVFLAGAIGTGSALGFALKHYFLIVPLLLELWLVVGVGRRWRPLRPETVAMIMVGVAYAAAVLLLAPDFLTTVVPLVRLAYGSVGAPSIRYLFGPFAVTALATLILLAAHARHVVGGKTPFAATLLVAAVGFTSIYFVQFKGWTYHAIPMLGCASLALAALLAEARTVPRLLALLAPATLFLPLILSAEESLQWRNRSDDLLRAVSGLPPGTPVGFINEDTAVAWSITLQRQFRYPSRYNGYWMLGAIRRNEVNGSHDARLTRLGQKIVSDTVEDFSCLPPRRILISRPQKGSWNENSIDPLPIFLRNRNFADFLGHYKVIGRTSIETLELVSPPPQAHNLPCRLAS